MPEQKSKEISLPDLAKYLKRLAASARDPATGNPSLAKVLSALAEALGAPNGRLLQEFYEDLRNSRTGGKSRRQSRRASLAIDAPYGDMPIEQVLASSSSMSRGELIDLGYYRFSIPRARLERMSREDIESAVRAAATNEESLHVIAAAAERSGMTRRA